ncbi:MAG: hypothetical protein ACKVP4_03145 [Hyphomicrobium sp.]
MAMFKAAMAVAAILIGAIAAVLGAIVIVSAIANGSILVITGPTETGEAVSRATSPADFYRLVAIFGVAPFLAGALAVRLGWRAIG